MAGFKYYGDNIKTNNEHTPILITKTSDKTKNCDAISIVYGDVDYDDVDYATAFYIDCDIGCK